tara:strand:+ start:22 stop:198 length:177 start_codon:yes stop_codon:yes gene_type:complete
MDNMSITSAQYNSEGDRNVSIEATINGQKLSVPLDPENRHYAAILEWVAEGNTIQEAD